MKKKLYLLLIYSFFIISFSRAQTNGEKEVAEAVLKFNKAMVDADKKGLEQITSDQLSYGHSSGKVENKAEFVDAVVNGPFDFETLDGADQTIQIIGETAFVRHIFLSRAKDNGKPVEVRIGNFQVWQKQKGEWKLVARQAYKI